MILESYYWRKELIKTAKKLKKKFKVYKKWSPSKYAKFEKEIMFGFYIIRKLIEANKLTDRLVSTKIECTTHENNGTKLTKRNFHDFFEYYDFENFKTVKCDLKFLNNQFVHSYIFSPVISIIDVKSKKLMEKDDLTEDKYFEIYENAEKEVTDIYFNSDKNKNKTIYKIGIKSIIEIFNNVGNCNVTNITMSYNPKKEDWDVFQTDEINEISKETLELIKRKEEE